MITYKSYSFTYAGASKPALKNISFHLEAGSWLWLAGPAGGGKSTLLQGLVPEASPQGRARGEVLFHGRALDTYSPQERLEKIASQGPRLALGPGSAKLRDIITYSAQNLAWSPEAIQARLADLSPVFDLEPILDKSLGEVSQGQASRASLAASFFLHPDLVLLDDAFDDLDPFRRQDMWRFIKGLQEDRGLTVITASQDGGLAAFADLVLALDQGRMTYFGDSQGALAFFYSQSPSPYPMPEVSDLAFRIQGHKTPIPTTLRQARFLGDKEVDPVPLPEGYQEEGDCVLEASRVRFRYEPSIPLLEDISYTLKAKDRAYLFGTNGVGKSTLLRLMAGFLKAWEGRVFRKDRAALPYFGGEAEAYFHRDEVSALIDHHIGSLASEARDRAHRLGQAFRILDLHGHPFDLSAGAKQRLALWMVLARPAKAYLLDEPTAHLDTFARQALEDIFQGADMADRGVLMAGQDMSFAAQTCNRAAILFDGQISGDARLPDFFARMTSYTTDTAQIFRHTYPHVFRPDQVRGLG